MKAFCAAATAALLLAGPAIAQGDRVGDPDFLSLSVGWFDAIQQDDPAAEFRLEWRGGEEHRFWLFKPTAGAMTTTDGSGYFYAGVLIDLYFGNRIVLTPSFTPGLYIQGGGKNLGGELEFRSQIELSYRFDDRSRLGISLSHMSNADTGRDNPGQETIAITYAIPTSRLFGR